MKLRLTIAIILLIVVACAKPAPRRPKQHGTHNFYKEVIESNKKLNAIEKKRLENWITQDTIHQYKTSANGLWYYYNQKDSIGVEVSPKAEQVVTINFDVRDINDAIIYEKQTKDYKVDKEDFILGLQDGIKLMKKGETITFVIPSYRAYGVTGDGNKIKGNQALKSTITLIDIK